MAWMDFSVENLRKDRRQLRVAVVTETHLPALDGVAMATHKFVDGLLSIGHEVQLIRPRNTGDQIPVTRDNLRETLAHSVPLPRKDGLKVGFPARSLLLRQWRDERPDVVQIFTGGPLGWSALSVAKRLRIPVVTECHARFDFHRTGFGFKWLKHPVAVVLRRFHNRGDLTLVPTRALQAALLASGIRNVEVVARGIDMELFNPLRRDRSLRMSWGAGEGDLVVACVDCIGEDRGSSLLRRAFSAIRALRPTARRLAIGNTSDREQPNPTENASHIVTGPLAGPDLARHYASADILLLAGGPEVCDGVTSEALACGLPVIAFREGFAAELVSHGSNGLLAPPGDEEVFIQNAVAAASAPLLAILRRNAAPSVAHLEWKAIVARLADKLELIIHRRQHRGHHVDSGIVLAQV